MTATNKLFIHVPPFVQTDHYPVYEFSTIEELAASGNIDSYLSNGQHLELAGNKLMSVSQDKFTWYVIGRVKFTEGISLPKWKAEYKDNQ
jgi:hypothetical protein